MIGSGPEEEYFGMIEVGEKKLTNEDSLSVSGKSLRHNNTEPVEAYSHQELKLPEANRLLAKPSSFMNNTHRSQS